MSGTNILRKIRISQDKIDIADAENLRDAVFITLCRYQRIGNQPGAECWQADTRYKRPLLVNDIRLAWLDIVGADAMFPWHEDYVIDLFVGMRKAQRSQKVALCREMNIEVPSQWCGDTEA